MLELKKTFLLFLLITTALQVPITAVDSSEDRTRNYRSANETESDSLTDFAWKIGSIALKTAGVAGTVMAILPAIGFGAAGVTAGSLAAWFQGTVLGGTIAPGSLFATLQSVGAGVAGIPASTKAVLVGAEVASAVSELSKKESENENENEN